MKEENKNSIVRSKILNWYDENKRDYPWRKTRNLYQILISEIFLQKTMASSLSNIYGEFFGKYKDFSKILEVDINELQLDIKSLGLSNKRARILKDLSELVMKDHNGKIPEDPTVLKKINGIADYVSNTFLCFGLNKRTLFFDVNIKRFISRVFKSEEPKIKKNSIIEKLNTFLPASNYKHFYWAILDFCNKICQKNNPKCETCPISKYCSFFSNVIVK